MDCADFYMHLIRNLMAVSYHQNFAREIFVTLPKICFFRDYASNWHIVSEFFSLLHYIANLAI